MGFALNEEQTILQDVARKFFQEKMPVAHLRQLRDSQDPKSFDPQLWQEMAALGLTGTLISEDYDGTNFGALGLCLVLEEAGRTLAPSPLLSTSLIGAACLSLDGSEALKKQTLPKIASGEIVIALALEEGAHHAPYQIKARAVKSNGGFKISGSKVFVIDGMAGEKIIFAARTSGIPGERSGITLFLLDAGQLQRQPMQLADSRNYARVSADNLAVSADQIIGQENEGAEILDPVLDLARIGMASEMLGGIRAVFEQTLTHLKERKQFGAIIGSFQALKHRAAQMFCEIELSHSVARDAASAAQERRNNIPSLASLAKARLCDCARLVTSEAVQMHGGMGMTDEIDIGLFLKRARVQAAAFGDARYHRDRFATLEGF